MCMAQLQAMLLFLLLVLISPQLLALVDVIYVPLYCQNVFCFEDADMGNHRSMTQYTHFLNGLEYLEVIFGPHNGQALYPWYAHPESMPYLGKS